MREMNTSHFELVSNNDNDNKIWPKANYFILAFLGLSFLATAQALPKTILARWPFLLQKFGASRREIQKWYLAAIEAILGKDLGVNLTQNKVLHLLRLVPYQSVAIYQFFIFEF